MKITKKRKGFELKMATLKGKKGTYIFFKTANGAYHAFLVVATKDAIKDCGAKGHGNTRQLCKKTSGFWRAKESRDTFKYKPSKMDSMIDIEEPIKLAIVTFYKDDEDNEISERKKKVKRKLSLQEINHFMKVSKAICETIKNPNKNWQNLHKIIIYL